MIYYSETVEYRLYYINAIGQRRSKVCYTVEEAHEAYKKLEAVGATVLNIQQTNNIIFDD